MITRNKALSACMDEGALVRTSSFASGRYMKFVAGAFILVDSEGENPSALNAIPTSSEWELYTPPVVTELAYHVNIESGVGHTSLVGSDKFTQRQANCKLRYLGVLTPLASVA